MKRNYKIYSTDGTFLEYVEKLADCSYGKPALTKDMAERLGCSCYFVRIPGSPADITINKEAHFRLCGNFENTVWCIICAKSDWSHGPNVIVVSREESIRARIESLINNFGVDENDIRVVLRPIE